MIATVRLLRRLVAPLSALAALECGGGDLVLPSGGGGDGGNVPNAIRSTLSADPASIQAASGRSTVTVTVRDSTDAPVDGASVALRATGGDNTLTQPSGPTGADGIATGTLQSTIPGTKVISALVNGAMLLRQTVEVTVTPASEAGIELIEGDGQNIPAGASVPVQPTVRATDGSGQPVAGVEVTFVVTGGGGSVDGATQTTNADGIARVGAWTLGADPGTNTLEARAGALPGGPVVFTADGTGGGVDHFVFSVQPHDANKGELFRVEVTMVDASGDVVPLNGIEIYLGLFPDGSEVPANRRLLGDRFRETESGTAVFNELGVTVEGRYRFRALSDDFPALGPHGPTPYLFSDPFDVE